MADDDSSSEEGDGTIGFRHVFRTELGLIKERRDRKRNECERRASAQRSTAESLPDDSPEGGHSRKPRKGDLDTVAEGGFSDDHPYLDAVGLCLSGGGIRSAAFCLGVLQALDKTRVLEHVDYLSTVSGGGYIGSSLSAGMSTGGGRFPFACERDQDEPPGVEHIRNYSSYLTPHGKTDVLESLVIYLRGLVANANLVLPWLLFAAYVTVRSNPTTVHLRVPDFFRIPVRDYFPFKHVPLPYDHFNLTTYSALLLLGLLAAWSLIRSGSRQAARPEVPSALTTAYGWAFVGLLIVAFFELQPFVLDRIWNNRGGLAETVTAQVQRATVVLAPLAGAIAVFRSEIQAFIKRAMESPARSGRTAAYLSKAMLYLAAAIVPLILWAVYFQLSWWGIADCREGCGAFPSGLAQTPGWIKTVAGRLFGGRPYPIATLYLASFGVLLVLSLLLRPNANSLHRLYRDRLSKAFLFRPPPPGEDPAPPDGAAPPQPGSRSMFHPMLGAARDAVDRMRDQLARTSLLRARTLRAGQDLPPLDGLKLSRLDPGLAPYHILNTALNIQGSKAVNKRSRNADFFMFSHAYVGSEATGYVRTRAMEEIVPELDLGTGMAISAAAASPNMGRQTIRPLTPSLTLLNVRIGFWLRNPKHVRFSRENRLRARLREFFSLYFLYELVANLRETSWNVYVTDGGHLENLGAYELLKRRCRTIIVVDAEADPEMTFGSFVTLQRYARIDLGVRIDLPWEKIRDATLRVSRDFAQQGTTDQLPGPHCAIGEIEYRNGGKGLLIYIKSSMTGDENDYVLDYKNRYPMFPHESTGDQFFSEEQFEAYRALGFHAAMRFSERLDGFAHLDPDAYACLTQDVGLLDALVPPASASDPCRPGRHRTFADVLNAAVRPDGDACDPSPEEARPKAVRR